MGDIFEELVEQRCPFCHCETGLLSKTIRICDDCIRERFSEACHHLEAVHADSRRDFDLRAKPLRSPNGIPCPLCSNACMIAEGEMGFCGLRTVRNSRLVHLAGTPERGFLHWYRDPLPTNCVADWVCEGGRHRGEHNLAVFYVNYTSNCLFSQNWHFREMRPELGITMSAVDLASTANSRIFCVCFFGGDPASQMPHALSTARALAEKGVRICWETNGIMHPKMLDRALDLSLWSRGCIKFDLKTLDDTIHRALTGVSNHRTLENFACCL